MKDVFGLIAVFAALVGVLLIMIRGMRPRGGPGSAGARSLRQLTRYTDSPRSGGLLVGFLSVVAITAFMDVTGAPGAQTVAGALGVTFAILSTPALRGVRDIIGAIAGVLGTIATFGGIVQTSRCVEAHPLFTVTIGALVVIVAALAALAAGLGGRGGLLLTPLAIFAALEFLAFLTLPLGIPLVETSNPAVAVSIAIIGAIAFGALAGYVPKVAIALGTAAVAAVTIGTEVLWGTACAGVRTGSLIALIVFIISYGVVRLIAGWIRR